MAKNIALEFLATTLRNGGREALKRNFESVKINPLKIDKDWWIGRCVLRGSSLKWVVAILNSVSNN